MQLIENFKLLQDNLNKLGFNSAKLNISLLDGLSKGEPRFNAYFQEQYPGETLHICFEVSKNDLNGFYHIPFFDALMISKGQYGSTHKSQATRILDSDVDKDLAYQVLIKDLREPTSAEEESIGLSKAWALNYTQNDFETISINQLNKNVMNTQNADFLKKSLLNLGFGDKLNAKLDKEMAAKTPEFKLGLQHEFNQKTVDYTLHFKAGDNKDMYFFNKYDATISHKDDPAKDINQSFFINKGSGITAKEAFNLMEGRAVHKQLYNLEGQKYQSWLTLDNKNLTDSGNMKIRHFHENYGFDIDKVIAGKGIKELEDPKAKEELMCSLKKGNAQQITVGGEDGDKKYFIAANPQFKTVDLFDHQMKKIKREELLQTDQKPVKNLKQGEQKKEDAPAKKQSRKSKVRV